MDDRDNKASRSAPLGARMRSALGKVRTQGAASLRGVGRSVAGAGDRLKHIQTGERLGAAVEARRTLKKAADAQRRGNPALAYRILESEVGERPDDAKLVGAFWSAALVCERAEDAAPSMQHIIRALAGAGKPDQALELWNELRGALPSALVDPSALVRMALALESAGRADQMAEALREAVNPLNNGLSPGLAVRVAEMARDLDPPTALAAARHALASPDLHESKRARLQEMIAEIERAEAVAAAAEPAPSGEGQREVRPEPAQPHTAAPPAAAGVVDHAVAGALETHAPASRFVDIKVNEGVPESLLEEAMALELPDRRKARLAYAKIEALAVAEVRGLAIHPVVLVDVVLNWKESGEPVLRVLRMRSDAFDARTLEPAESGEVEAFRAFLAELLTRSNAIPLPDLESAQGVHLRAFESLEAYHREVLQIAS
jgi:tetratricopeptide (TPR) repeat protein